MRTPPLRRRTDQEVPGTNRFRALVADDHDIYREYVTSLASRCGFEVTACSDGADALELLSGGSQLFDLLVIDCEMPGMGGLDLIQQVRADERHRDVYAVMFSGRADLDTKLSALRLGYDQYIAKSCSELEVGAKLDAVRRLIARQQRLQERVRELYGLATRDELTGLFNRRFFFSEAERLLGEGKVANLILFDLDEFKPINDTLGHLAGDRILRDIGALFLRRTRSEDVIARFGGDEFVMLVPALLPPEVEALAQRMSSEISSAQWVFGPDTFSVGVTTGISCSSLLEKPALGQLLSAGDRDLYKNKWMRKNPDEDPSLYEYDRGRDAHVAELLTLTVETMRRKKADA